MKYVYKLDNRYHKLISKFPEYVEDNEIVSYYDDFDNTKYKIFNIDHGFKIRIRGNSIIQIYSSLGKPDIDFIIDNRSTEINRVYHIGNAFDHIDNILPDEFDFRRNHIISHIKTLFKSVTGIDLMNKNSVRPAVNNTKSIVKRGFVNVKKIPLPNGGYLLNDIKNDVYFPLIIDNRAIEYYNGVILDNHAPEYKSVPFYTKNGGIVKRILSKEEYRTLFKAVCIHPSNLDLTGYEATIDKYVSDYSKDVDKILKDRVDTNIKLQSYNKSFLWRIINDIADVWRSK